jgi:hypothetical protein
MLWVRSRKYRSTSPVIVGTAKDRKSTDQLEVPVEQLVNRRGGARVAALVDLPGQTPRNLLGLGHRLRAGWHDLAEVVAPLADWVDPGVHAYPKRAARQLLDPPARPCGGAFPARP